MEPGTPNATVKYGDVELPLTWTKRSEALISRHGHNVLSLIAAMRDRRTGLYATCVGIAAALPAQHAPQDPTEIAEWFADGAARDKAAADLIVLWRHFYPLPAQKKSASKD